MQHFSENYWKKRFPGEIFTINYEDVIKNPNERIADISQKAEGFIYYVSREGVTGIQTSLSHDLDSQVENLKSITSLPLVVGFGISTPSQATKVAKIADGVVVGSAIVDFIDQNKNSSELPQLLEDFVSPLIEAIRF
mgnify:CR=1 FL=1